MSSSAAGVSLVGTVILLNLGASVNPSTTSGPQDIFQAEEGSNVTLTWLFPVNTDTPAASLYIDIIKVNPHSCIYLYDSRFGAVRYQDQLYRGRVWCDLELAKKGLIECLFTELRLNDTSTYIFIVVINRISYSKRCDLNVTAASDQTINEPSEPAGRERIGFYMGGSLFTVVATTLAVRYCIFAHKM